MDVPESPIVSESANGMSAVVAASESVSALRLEQICEQLAELQARTRQMQPGPAAPHGDAKKAHGPHQLTWRARRLLLRGREQLERLRTLAIQLHADGGDDHLGTLYLQTVAMAELGLRSVQTFPDRASEQLALCDGLAATLQAVEERTNTIREVVERRQAASTRVEQLSDMFGDVLRGQSPPLQRFRDLASSVAEEARSGVAIRWHEAHADRPTRWAAAHCLNAGQVAARVAQGDERVELTLAALLHDVGMASLDADALGHAGKLTDEQQRHVEHHVQVGTHAVRKLAPQERWLADVIHTHHERLDGSGYPEGAQGLSIPRIARLLAICDVYAALATPRPHRPARSPRAALTETLHEAERGKLDADLAERLLTLTCYPVGSMVELATGQIGLVIAVRTSADVAAPARPLLQILTSAGGTPRPWPEYVDLTQSEGTHIVRSLTAAEGRVLLGGRCPQLL